MCLRLYYNPPGPVDLARRGAMARAGPSPCTTPSGRRPRPASRGGRSGPGPGAADEQAGGPDSAALFAVARFMPVSASTRASFHRRSIDQPAPRFALPPLKGDVQGFPRRSPGSCQPRQHLLPRGARRAAPSTPSSTRSPRPSACRFTESIYKDKEDAALAWIAENSATPTPVIGADDGRVGIDLGRLWRPETFIVDKGRPHSATSTSAR